MSINFLIGENLHINDNNEYIVDLDEEISFEDNIEDGDMLCCVVGGHKATQLPGV